MAVVLGLIGMLLVPSNVFIAIGLGAIFVVIAAVFASMTLLPAILSLLGDRVNKLSIPWIGMAQTGFDETKPGGVWDKISRGVMRQPLISLILGGGLLVAAMIPFFDINTGSAGVSTMPDGIESKGASWSWMRSSLPVKPPRPRSSSTATSTLSRCSQGSND